MRHSVKSNFRRILLKLSQTYSSWVWKSAGSDARSHSITRLDHNCWHSLSLDGSNFSPIWQLIDSNLLLVPRLKHANAISLRTHLHLWYPINNQIEYIRVTFRAPIVEWLFLSIPHTQYFSVLQIVACPNMARFHAAEVHFWKLSNICDLRSEVTYSLCA